MLGEFISYNSTEKDVVRRLSLLIGGDPDFQPYQKGGGNDSWILDRSNNWWLLATNRRNEKSGHTYQAYRLTYRYAQGKPEGFFAALELVICELTGLKHPE